MNLYYFHIILSVLAPSNVMKFTLSLHLINVVRNVYTFNWKINYFCIFLTCSSNESLYFMRIKVSEMTTIERYTRVGLLWRVTTPLNQTPCTPSAATLTLSNNTFETIHEHRHGQQCHKPYLTIIIVVSIN
jgi:hypothetical protein